MRGYLQITFGPMFSGKTSRLIDLYKQYTYCNIPVIVINHADDNRYDNVLLSNHDDVKINCHKFLKISDFISNHYNILNNENLVILINEGQFFEDLYDNVEYLVNDLKKCVYVCGLDGDYKRNKFGSILDLIPICDKVSKLHSICSSCKDGTSAIFTHRISNDTQQKLIGTHTYQPLCRSCYNLKNNLESIFKLSIEIPEDSHVKLPDIPRIKKISQQKQEEILSFDC